MSTYSCEVSGRSPLLLRLAAPRRDAGVVGVGAELQRWFAFGETFAGATSRPQLYRPSMPGTSDASSETAVVALLDRGGLVQPKCLVASVFSISPSLPAAPPTTGNLPFLTEYRYPRGKGIVVMPSQSTNTDPATYLRSESCLMLYAVGTGLHTHTGGFVWEEL